jgi:hypothetical protein
VIRDRVGHPAEPVQVLVAYCHFAVIYLSFPTLLLFVVETDAFAFPLTTIAPQPEGRIFVALQA